jgi:hypothetical protein
MQPWQPASPVEGAGLGLGRGLGPGLIPYSRAMDGPTWKWGSLTVEGSESARDRNQPIHG